MRPVKVFATVLTLGVAILHSAEHAAASCAGPAPSVADVVATPGRTVFVGTVVELANGGRWPTFAVEEIWAGDVPTPEVEVFGGPPSPGGEKFAVSSVERRYDLGSRYVVTPTTDSYGFSGSRDLDAFADTNCSSTTLWDASLAQFRPATATTIEQDQPILPRTQEDDSPPYVMIALTTFLVAGGCLYLLFRRGSIAYRARQDEERSSGS